MDFSPFCPRNPDFVRLYPNPYIKLTYREKHRFKDEIVAETDRYEKKAINKPSCIIRFQERV
jgi:hypothetical protein